MGGYGYSGSLTRGPSSGAYQNDIGMVNTDHYMRLNITDRNRQEIII
jgi:hypothetical protein